MNKCKSCYGLGHVPAGFGSKRRVRCPECSRRELAEKVARLKKEREEKQRQARIEEELRNVQAPKRQENYTFQDRSTRQPLAVVDFGRSDSVLTAAIVAAQAATKLVFVDDVTTGSKSVASPEELLQELIHSFSSGYSGSSGVSGYRQPNQPWTPRRNKAGKH